MTIKKSNPTEPSNFTNNNTIPTNNLDNNATLSDGPPPILNQQVNVINNMTQPA